MCTYMHNFKINSSYACSMVKAVHTHNYAKARCIGSFTI